MTKLIDYNNNNSDHNEEVDKLCDLSMEFIKQRGEGKKDGKRNSYSDFDKKAALSYYSMGWSIRAISVKMKIPRTTIHNWVNGVGVDNIDFTDVMDRIKGTLEPRMINIQSRGLVGIANKIHEGTALDQAKVVGILADKINMMNGNPTHRIEHVSKKIDVIDVSKNDLTDKRRYLEAELTDLREDG